MVAGAGTVAHVARATILLTAASRLHLLPAAGARSGCGAGGGGAGGGGPSGRAGGAAAGGRRAGAASPSGGRFSG